MINLGQNLKTVLFFARNEANRFHHTYITSGHLLAGILKLPETSGAMSVLAHSGFNVSEVQTLLEAHLGHIPTGDPLTAENIPFTAAAKKILAESSRQSRKFQADYVGSEHMLLALTLEKEGVLQLIFEEIGLDAQSVEIAIRELPEFAPNS